MSTRPVHPFRIANFRAYWLSRFSGTIAVSAMSIVIGWQVYNLARVTMDVRQAAFMLGMIGFAQFVPLFLLTPVTGLVADSVDRRWIVRSTTALLVATAGMLWFLTWSGHLTLIALFAAAVAFGIARAFSGPAYSALAPNLVPRESLPTAIAVSSIAWQVGTIAGPSVGGLLYAIHPEVAYGVATALFAVALTFMFLIGPVPQPPSQPDHRPLARIAEGFSYVRRNRLVQAAITLDLFAVLLAGATSLLPVYARDILHVGSQGLGVLAAGMGIGAATTAIWFSFKPMSTNVGVKMLAAVVVFGLSILTFGIASHVTDALGLTTRTVQLGSVAVFVHPAFLLSLVALIVAGGADMVSVYVRQSLIQLHTPDAMRGRVSAVSQLTISASNELGEFESGVMASLLGPVGAVVFGGLGAIGVTLLWARLFPELGAARTFDPPEILQTEPSHGDAKP
ncbi:MFS transporter [Sphingomonas melonis TY]|jgi:MFS family permease|uniref:MFS transporter n=1 Tax=Sphingomonas melonis TY TaxID=621456 RepID=A0A154NBT3_9SPHN|nr:MULTISPECIES: MFS transporter [Sphingomonas]AOW23665.1 MFS transporter [Sphingomonas melonis TY]ATI54667.1 MFS transporter [Sphingomonas melonis]KZB96950.1 MFS transporter [Sphingomonas melonis TY]MBI0531139.1 MFS transporter [Sphingomonas sp. TX0522]MBX8844729.1 MFS transporter [Sphingomonas melonis]